MLAAQTLLTPPPATGIVFALREVKRRTVLDVNRETAT
jgi:hypothetical protein